MRIRQTAPQPPVRLVHDSRPRLEAARKAVALGGLAGAANALDPRLSLVTLPASLLATNLVTSTESTATERNLYRAGMVASALSAWLCPNPLARIGIVTGQALAQGAYAYFSTPDHVLPDIDDKVFERKFVEEANLRKGGKATTGKQAAEGLSLIQKLAISEKIGLELLTPEAIQGTREFHELRREDPNARAKVEKWTGQTFPGQIYTYANRTLGPGVSCGDDLALSRQLLAETTPVGRQIFVTGHELTHLQNRDMAAGIAAAEMQTLLGEVPQKEFEPVWQALSHAHELRADRGGVDLSLANHRSKDEILKTARDLFSKDKECVSHPAGTRRIEEIEAYLASR